MRAGAVGGDPHPQRALAAGLDHGPGGFTEQRDVTGEPFRVGLGDVEQPVKPGGDLLTLVQDQGEVVDEFLSGGQGGEGVEVHRVPGLHVHGAEPVETVVAVCVRPPERGEVVGRGDGIDVTGQHDPAGQVPVRPGDQGVTESVDGHADTPADLGCKSGQRCFQGIGQGLFLVGLAGDVHQLAGELDGGGRQVNVRGCRGGSHRG